MSDSWRHLGNSNTGGRYTCDINWTCPPGSNCANWHLGGCQNGCYPAGYTPYTSSFTLPGWYRIQTGSGFDYLPEGVVAQSQCGTSGTGYLIGTHPTVEEGIVTRSAGFTWDDALNCVNTIQVVNCMTEYFVYYLPEACSCAMAYCASNAVPTNLTL